MTAKGRGQRLKGEDTFDVVNHWWRRCTAWDRGVVARIKRRMNKRVRRETGEALRKEL
jgi:hypothetical protein